MNGICHKNINVICNHMNLNLETLFTYNVVKEDEYISNFIDFVSFLLDIYLKKELGYTDHHLLVQFVRLVVCIGCSFLLKKLVISELMILLVGN